MRHEHLIEEIKEIVPVEDVDSSSVSFEQKLPLPFHFVLELLKKSTDTNVSTKLIKTFEDYFSVLDTSQNEFATLNLSFYN